MKEKIVSLNQFILRITASPKFFYVVMAIFLLQALWISFVARYPQAFDENFHFGLIKLHAQQWLPYFTHQPDGASVYGSVVRDPSYLYHYILSLPYRLLSSLGASETIQVIILRLLNVAMFAGGLLAFYKTFREMAIGIRTVHLALLFFVLLPVVPLLAGQINYDNAIVLITGLLLLYATRLARKLMDTTHQISIPVTLLLQIFVVGTIGCLVKYSYLPIFFAVLLIEGFLIVRRYRRSMKYVFVSGSKLAFVGLLLLTAGLLFLAIERYGVNLATYRSPAPSCETVLSVEECLDYAPWARNYAYAATYPRPQLQGYVAYPFVWLYRMVWETMFTITSYFKANGKVAYFGYSPLLIGYSTALAMLLISLLGVVMHPSRVFKGRQFKIICLIGLFYTGVLFAQNFSDYHETGEVVAVHGRYVVMFMPILMIVFARAMIAFIQRLPANLYQMRGLVLVIVLMLFMQGGGITHWIRRSTPDWYFQTAAARSAGDVSHAVFDKLILLK